MNLTTKTTCTTHADAFKPNECFECADAEMAWIHAKAQALFARGYTTRESQRIGSLLAQHRRRNIPLTSELVQAEETLKRGVH